MILLIWVIKSGVEILRVQISLDRNILGLKYISPGSNDLTNEQGGGLHKC